MTSPNIRISQQLKGGYNPDGTPGTISTGVPGPPPSDAQVSTAVASYLKTYPISIQVMNQAMNQDPVMLGPGSNGANDVVVTVGTNGGKDAWVQAGNGADPMNKSGRQPVNLYLLAEFGGSVTLSPTVNVGSATIAYGSTGATVTAPDKVTVYAPNLSIYGSLTALGNFGVGQQSFDPGGLGGFNTLWPRTDGGWYTKAGAGTVTRLPVHWGTGTSFPASGRITGDLYVHTGLACTMRFNGTSWVQAEDSTVSSSTARTNISTTYSALLYQGFRVVQTDLSLIWAWNGSDWALVRSMGAPPLAGLTITPGTASSTLTPVGYSVTDHSNGLISVNGSTGVITFNATGKVSFEMVVWSDSGTARWVWAQAVLPATQALTMSNLDNFLVAPAGFSSGGTTRQLLTGTWAVTAGDTTSVKISSSVAASYNGQGNIAYL